MKFKDYYETLGVSRGADAEEIKRAYRKQARKYHPDVSKERNAEDKFKDVQEAYEVLKDTEKRAAYDQLGRDYRSGQQFRPPPDWEQRFSHGGGAGAADSAISTVSAIFSPACSAAPPDRGRPHPAVCPRKPEPETTEVEVCDSGGLCGSAPPGHRQRSWPRPAARRAGPGRHRRRPGHARRGAGRNA